MVDRISSFGQTGQLLTNNLRLQSNYAKTQVQISTGLKDDRYEGIADNASRLFSLEADFDRITQQNENAQLALDRTEVMYDAMSTMIAETQIFAADLSSSVSSFGLQGNDLRNAAQTRLNQIVGNLNTQLAGRYLFAGAVTETAPVDLTGYGGQVFVLPGPSTSDFTYYQGDTYIQNVEAADGFNVNYGVRANNTAFEQIIRAYDLIITNPTDPDTLQEALRVIQIGLDELTVLQAATSQDAQTLQGQIDANEEDLLLLTEQIADLTNVDLAEATTKLKQLETQLEASYAVTTDLLNLSLVDFIR